MLENEIFKLGNFIFYVIYIITGGYIISSNVVFIFIFSKAL